MTQNTEAGLSYLSEMQLDQAVNRLFEDATTKKQKLERLQMEHAKQELEQTQDKPSINARSKRMSTKNETLPLYERFKKVKERQEKRVEKR